MRLIVNAFWMATCLAARVYAAPLELYVYLLSLLIWWTETRRNLGTRRVVVGHPDKTSSQ
jgi:hypothetical protein